MCLVQVCYTRLFLLGQQDQWHTLLRWKIVTALWLTCNYTVNHWLILFVILTASNLVFIFKILIAALHFVKLFLTCINRDLKNTFDIITIYLFFYNIFRLGMFLFAFHIEMYNMESFNRCKKGIIQSLSWKMQMTNELNNSYNSCQSLFASSMPVIFTHCAEAHECTMRDHQVCHGKFFLQGYQHYVYLNRPKFHTEKTSQETKLSLYDYLLSYNVSLLNMWCPSGSFQGIKCTVTQKRLKNTDLC